MEDTLQGLSILELHLFVAVLHLQGRHLHGSAGRGGGGGGAVAPSAAGSSASASSGLNSSSSSGEVNGTMFVHQVLQVCDILVEMFKQKVSLRWCVLLVQCVYACMQAVYMFDKLF